LQACSVRRIDDACLGAINQDLSVVDYDGVGLPDRTVRSPVDHELITVDNDIGI